MTEKRFRQGKSILMDFPTGTIIDKETGEKYYDGIKPSYISSKELVKVLNGLYHENKQLKSQLLAKEDLIQQLKIALDSDCYNEARKYKKEFIRVCDELFEANMDYKELKSEYSKILRRIDDGS